MGTPRRRNNGEEGQQGRRENLTTGQVAIETVSGLHSAQGSREAERSGDKGECLERRPGGITI
jgi:hypothetical protein